MIFTKETSDTNVTSVNNKFTSIKEYLSSRSILIESSGLGDERYTNAAIMKFASDFARLQVSGGDRFIRYLRKCIVDQNKSCRYTIEKADSMNTCIELANLLCSVGALVNAVEKDGAILGRFNFASKTLINFINGEFLEIAVYAMTKRCLNSESSIDWEVLPNVITSSLHEKKEYDLLLRINNEIFVLELKSGKNEAFEYYKQRGLNLGLDPDHQILVTSDRTKDEMSLISYFQGFTVVNYATFEETLLKLITKIKNNNKGD